MWQRRPFRRARAVHQHAHGLAERVLYRPSAGGVSIADFARANDGGGGGTTVADLSDT
jgi:hypothetical protein